MVKRGRAGSRGIHRAKRTTPYYSKPCPRCGRPLTMRKGRRPKCPVCDGTGYRKPLTKRIEL